jgi:hypothetical protein
MYTVYNGSSGAKQLLRQGNFQLLVDFQLIAAANIVQSSLGGTRRQFREFLAANICSFSSL